MRSMRQRNPLKVKMFVFSDPDLINAVIAAQESGVNVQVMLNPARRSGEEDNDDTRKQLEAGRYRSKRQ